MPEGCKATGLVLAGGRGRRMGGAEKSFIPLCGRTLIEHVIARAAPQVDRLLINANADDPRYAALGLPVVRDCVPGFQGPLAGILAGLAWSQEHAPEAQWLATFPNDSPLFPRDLVMRLVTAARERRALVASVVSAGRHHPVFAVWSTAIRITPEELFETRRIRRVDAGLALFPSTTLNFPAATPDPFFNVNTKEDLALVERLLAS